MTLKERTCSDVLAVIPARGSSKGLPRKNILPLGGKPLIAYSIEAAKACARITRVVVSTDDPEIADVARACGADVPFLRPTSLAQDRTDPGRAIDHIVRRLYKGHTEGLIVVVLYPTHPFRPPGLVDLLLDKVQAGCRLAQTVRAIPVTPDTCLALTKKKQLRRFFDQDPGGLPGRQGAAPLPDAYYRPYGLGEVILHSREACTLPVYYHVVTEKPCLVDIDYPEDLRLAELVLAHGLFTLAGGKEAGKTEESGTTFAAVPEVGPDLADRNESR